MTILTFRSLFVFILLVNIEFISLKLKLKLYLLLLFKFSYILKLFITQHRFSFFSLLVISLTIFVFEVSRYMKFCFQGFGLIFIFIINISSNFDLFFQRILKSNINFIKLILFKLVDKYIIKLFIFVSNYLMGKFTITYLYLNINMLNLKNYVMCKFSNFNLISLNFFECFYFIHYLYINEIFSLYYIGLSSFIFNNHLLLFLFFYYFKAYSVLLMIKSFDIIYVIKSIITFHKNIYLKFLHCIVFKIYIYCTLYSNNRSSSGRLSGAPAHFICNLILDSWFAGPALGSDGLAFLLDVLISILVFCGGFGQLNYLHDDCNVCNG